MQINFLDANEVWIMDEIILEERKINKFPSPYNLECTPYIQPDFSEKTRRKSLREKKQHFSNECWLKICKVIIIGDVSVGKTCLVNRFCRKLFDSNYKSTIGVDFEVEKFLILGIPFTLQIWDTAGQERFKSIAQSYYRGAHVIVIVFDLTNCESLSNCKKWLNEALNANIAENPLIFLVGTKLDLLSYITFKNIKYSAEKVATDINAEFWGISSKTGKNVNKLFNRVAALSFDAIIQKGYDTKRSQIIKGDKLTGKNNLAGKEKGQKKPCCNY